MFHILPIMGIQRTLGKAQVIDRIQDIGFANTVLTQHTGHFAIELKVAFLIILEIVQIETLKLHDY